MLLHAATVAPKTSTPVAECALDGSDRICPYFILSPPLVASAPAHRNPILQTALGAAGNATSHPAAPSTWFCGTARHKVMRMSRKDRSQTRTQPSTPQSPRWMRPRRTLLAARRTNYSRRLNLEIFCAKIL